MTEIFDEIINRKNTESEKQDRTDQLFGGENPLPPRDAEMDLRTTLK